MEKGEVKQHANFVKKVKRQRKEKMKTGEEAKTRISKSKVYENKK